MTTVSTSSYQLYHLEPYHLTSHAYHNHIVSFPSTRASIRITWLRVRYLHFRDGILFLTPPFGGSQTISVEQSFFTFNITPFLASPLTWPADLLITMISLSKYVSHRVRLDNPLEVLRLNGDQFTPWTLTNVNEVQVGVGKWLEVDLTVLTSPHPDLA